MSLDPTGPRRPPSDFSEREPFKALLESVKDYAIFMLDPTGRVATWNAGASHIKGYAASEILGKHFSVFYPESEGRTAKCEFELEVAARDGRFEDEGWRIRKDGSRFWANVVITAMKNEDGRLVGFVKVTRDLTERRRAEEEKLRLVQAQESNRLKDEFLATISHELRTPLNAILGWSAILEAKAEDPETRRIAETIRRNSQAQARLIEDILDMSRIVSGNLRLEIRRVDLAEILEEGVEVVRPAADAKGISIVEWAGGPAVIAGDPARLQQVVWNLLSNAVKFTNEGGEITAEVEQTGSMVRLAVGDTGQGIDPEMLPHVFERFRQADSSTTRRNGGLGLGLSIVKQIVELHGGVVSASSKGPGKGARFEVHLPIRTLSSRVESGARRRGKPIEELPRIPEASDDLEGLRVLVVDDEADARELLITLLSSRGAMVSAVGSAADARRALHAEHPVLLVSDIGMPGEDGYELMRSIRALPARFGGNIRSVALTAFARPEDRRRALDAGYDKYVAKPVDPSELLTMVRDLAAIASGD